MVKVPAWARNVITKVRAFIKTNPAAQTLMRALAFCFAFGGWHGFAVIAWLGLFAIGAFVWMIFEHRAPIVQFAEAIGYANTAEMTGGARFIRDTMIFGAGAFGIMVAMWRASALGSQAKTAEKRLLNEQFSNAAELMAKETTGEKPKPAIAARINGIYIMADLATKKPKEFAEQVVKNLIAYIKDKAQRTATLPPTKGESPARGRVLGGDVKAAFSALSNILGNEAIKKDIADESLDFSYQDFSRLYFFGIDLQHYKKWEETNFSGCFLTGTHFADGAEMLGANFSNAWLREARFNKAKLVCADFRGAVLANADMRGAELGGADMQGCFMRYAKLQEADNGEKTNLLKTQLAGANLMGANLNSALIYKTDIRGTVLSSGADLTDIEHLIDATLGETYMINAKIEKHVISKLSKWAKSAGRNIWLGHAEVAKQVSDPSGKINWRLAEYEDGYALAGVLMNFAEAPSYEHFWRPAYSHFREELTNIQRQAADLDLEKLPKNIPKEIRAWLKENKAKYSK